MKFFYYILGISVVLGFSSCETEVDLGAPYEKIPVVYGLLDINDTLHYIKITKAFSGSSNAIEGAQVADSSYFNTVDGVIEELVDNQVVREFQLRDTLITNKEDGAFYYPEQKLYYFKESNLNPEATYRLVLDIDEGDLNIEAETKLIDALDITSPSIFASFNFATPSSSNDNEYNSTGVKWTKNENASLYGLSMTVVFREEYADGSTQMKSLEWNLGQYDESDVVNNGVAVNVDGQEFYGWLGDNLENTNDITARVFQYVQINLSAADEVLKTYIDVSEPVTGIVQNKPEFTNIEGGRGIFASRNRTTSVQYELNKNSLLELCRGQYTGQYLFCSENSDYINESWYCN